MPVEGWTLKVITASSTMNSTSASIAEQADSMKQIIQVGPPPWHGVPWGNKSKGATLGRPLICTGVSTKDPILFHSRSLGWWNGAPVFYQIRSSFGASSWVVAEHGQTALQSENISGPQLYDWPQAKQERKKVKAESAPSPTAREASLPRAPLSIDRQSSRRMKSLEFSSIPPKVSSTPPPTSTEREPVITPIREASSSTASSLSRSASLSSSLPRRMSSLVMEEEQGEWSEEQNQELDEWSSLPGAPQAAQVHFNLFDDILDVFTDEVDNKDDPTFIGNAWGISMFEQAVFEADAAADLAYEKLLGENKLKEEEELAQLRKKEEEEKAAAVTAASGDGAVKGGVKEEGESQVKPVIGKPEVKPEAKKKAPPPQSPHVSMLDSMKWILKDEDILNDFQEKLEAEYAAESLLFYRETRDWKIMALEEKALARSKHRSSSSLFAANKKEKEKALEEARNIFNKYIKPGSDFQINVPSIMVKNLRTALGIENPADKAKQERAKKLAEEKAKEALAAALANGEPAPAPLPVVKEPPPPKVVLDPEVFAPAIREVTVMLLKDKVPAYIANPKAPRRVKVISEIEKCHRMIATWAMDENAIAESSNTRRHLKPFVPTSSNNADDLSLISSSVVSAKYFNPYFCSPPPPLPTSLLASLGRFPYPPLPRISPISASATSTNTSSSSSMNSNSGSGSALNSGSSASSSTSPIVPTSLSVSDSLASSLVEGGGGLHDIRSSYLESSSNAFEEELKAIDTTPCKTLIKIGVVYVKPRQYFQRDMFLNDTASAEFESFIKAFGHPEVIKEEQGPGFRGFTGGITPSALAEGVNSVPHYEDQVCELALHVSTHIRTDGDQQIHKTRHIGNDTVTVVWSEDSRDFLPSTFTSQLTAVSIVIYPHRRALPDTRLYRIQMIVKDPLGVLVSCTGPLTDGAVVTADLLPSLVRMTCVNAHFGLRKEINEELENSQRRMACLEKATAAAHEPRSKAFPSVYAY
jgi:hypothetical protein